MHRDWFMEGANVFVEIYTDRIEISSPGGLPKGMKFSDLGQKSIRRNALLADMLHRITFIEKAGTGIKRMRDEARAQHCPAPVFEENGFFTAIFYPNPEVRAQAGTKEAPSTAQVGTKKGPGRDQALAHEKAHEVESTPQVPHKHPTSAPQVTPQVMILLRNAMREASAADLQSALHLKDRVHFLKNYLEPSLDKGLVERTIPDKPRSSKQRYRTTAAGRTVLAHTEKETPS
jgi:ATP-dependent DNA helicase RecG